LCRPSSKVVLGSAAADVSLLRATETKYMVLPQFESKWPV
jgi:hypothetical protein